MPATGPLVVVGEGLAAGMGEYSLHARSQAWSFPAQIAIALDLPFRPPLFEPPGITAAGAGFPALALPVRPQSRVLDQIPPERPTNLAVPGYRVRDAVERRPCQPLIQKHDSTQTACNLILGILDFATGAPVRSQVELASDWDPALTIVCLGYEEAVEAVVTQNGSTIADARSFRREYERVLHALGPRSDRIVLTVPNPVDTAYCSTIEAAATACCVDVDLLVDLYGLRGDELVTIHGLHEIGFQLFGGRIDRLSANAVLPVSLAQEIDRRLTSLNDGLRQLAREQRVPVCDLYEVFRGIAERGVHAGTRRLTAAYLGGVYGLNGLYPGAAGHAVIANALISTINESFGVMVPFIDVTAIAAIDPIANYQAATGERWSYDTVRPRPPAPRRTARAAAVRASPAAGGDDPVRHETARRLRLPPGGEQVLPLHRESSYFGDGIGAVNCVEPRDVQWGTGGEWLFGGLAMVDSHLSGDLRIRFDTPVGDRVRFEVSFTHGFDGDDAVLAAPFLFRMPFERNRVDGVDDRVSRGTLDLATGEVTDLEVFARFQSDALGALVRINPTFPRQPLSFPGAYGSAHARFEQRDDGLLDFTFYGTTVVPLGPGIRWPLTFRSVDGHFASIPANGTVMRPHLHLSTRATSGRVAAGAGAPAAPPENEIREFTLYTHNSSFGDQFTLDVPELGGPGKGRSHVLGRLHVQFGPWCGNSVPIAVTCLPPAGVFAGMPETPVTTAFPGRLYPGLQGFDELLRFPTRTYALDDLAILDDPLDVAMAAIDLDSGQAINDVLHRGFIHQDLIFALIRVEPRTPKSSFLFRGPARLESGSQGEMVYRFNGVVRVPYPEGFLFPQSNLTTAFRVGPGSVLDPFVWIQAMEDRPQTAVAEGQARDVLASTGDRFSYRYRIPPARDGTAIFEYENHSQQGSFRLHALSSVSFTSSRSGDGTSDTVTFAGFGVWTKDGRQSIQQVAGQISTSAATPYVGIQIDSGNVSNVNTRPPDERLARP